MFHYFKHCVSKHCRPIQLTEHIFWKQTKAKHVVGRRMQNATGNSVTLILTLLQYLSYMADPLTVLHRKNKQHRWKILSQQFVSTCKVCMMYGCVWLLFQVLGCIHYIPLYNQHAPGCAPLHVSRLLNVKYTHQFVSPSDSDSQSHAPSPLPNCHGSDCYHHSLSLSLHLGYSCYDNYYACQSDAVSHRYTLLAHSCIQVSLETQCVFIGRFSAGLRLQ